MSSHFHFMGIGGISMSGLARHYLAEGMRVSGCDAAESTTVRELREAGVEVHLGHDPAHLADSVDLLISTMAVPNDRIPFSTEEIAEADRLGIESIKRVDLLGRLFRERTAVAVSGSHGKSSITGMLATLFVELADDPSVQIGANLPLIGGNMRHGRGPQLVAEVDESDPGFARLESGIALLSNLENDHIAGDYPERRNYHASIEDLQAAVCSFADRAGQLITCSDSAALEELLGDRAGRLTYGFAAEADFAIEDIHLTPGGSEFRLRAPDLNRVPVLLHVPGLHNAQNAAGALAAAAVAGLPLAEAAEVLAGYRGVGRRWQVWGSLNGADIVDDYAHHPAEVRATLAAARNTGQRIRAVLQPHRWIRTALHWKELAEAASAADEVLVLDVYAAGEDPIPGVSSGLIVDRIRSLGTDASHHTALSAVSYLQDTATENDLVLTLGAGDVWRVAASLSGDA